MDGNLIIGLITMVVCLAIQCLAVSLLLRGLLYLDRMQFVRPTPVRTSILLTLIMLALLAGNLVQITLWAGLFYAYGEFTDFSIAFYHSVVNFSTLGYGDIVMSEGRRLLGALEAANGVLMFGLTTGFLFMILSELMNKAWDELTADQGASGEAPLSGPPRA